MYIYQKQSRVRNAKYKFGDHMKPIAEGPRMGHKDLAHARHKGSSATVGFEFEVEVDPQTLENNLMSGFDKYQEDWIKNMQKQVFANWLEQLLSRTPIERAVRSLRMSARARARVVSFEDSFTILEVFEDANIDLTNLHWSSWQQYRRAVLMNDWIQASSEDSAVANNNAVSLVHEQLADLLGFEPATSSHPMAWSVVTDASLDKGAEIVSPAFDLETGIRELERILAWIRSHSFIRTSERTGLHINIGTFTPQDIDQIDWLKFLVVFNAGHTLKQFDRSASMYAPDRLILVLERVQQLDPETVLADHRTTNRIVFDTSIKYSSVNLSKLRTHNIIEIRAPGNEGYEQRSLAAQQTVLRALRALDSARNPYQDRKQYIRSLYKLQDTASFAVVQHFFKHYLNIEADIDDPENTIAQALETNPQLQYRALQAANVNVHRALLKWIEPSASTSSQLAALYRRFSHKDPATKPTGMQVLIELVLHAMREKLAEPSKYGARRMSKKSRIP